MNEPNLEQRLTIEYYEQGDGLLVFTEAFHLKRGFCCGSGCRHCPYEPKARRGETRVAPDLRADSAAR